MRGGLLLCLCALSLGCGGGRGGQGPAVVSTSALPEEEFDPLSLAEEHWLIEPVASGAEPQRPEPRAAERRDDLLYRVQIAALADSLEAHQRRDELVQALQEPIHLGLLRGRYIVRSRDFPRRQGALDFKQRLRVAGLDSGEAFILVLDAQAAGGGSLRVAPSRPGDGAEPVSGWRLLIGQFLANEEADQLKGRAVQRLKRSDVEVVFEAPWYKVEVGFFTQKAEAQEWSERLARRGFSNTLKKVRSDMTAGDDDE